MSSQNIKVVGIPTRPGQDGRAPYFSLMRLLERHSHKLRLPSPPSRDQGSRGQVPRPVQPLRSGNEGAPGASQGGSDFVLPDCGCVRSRVVLSLPRLVLPLSPPPPSTRPPAHVSLNLRADVPPHMQVSTACRTRSGTTQRGFPTFSSGGTAPTRPSSS